MNYYQNMAAEMTLNNISTYNFICNQHPKGRYGYTDDGFNHYLQMLCLIKDKMFNPDKPESKFITLCAEEKWDYAISIADHRNKEAFEYCDLFPKFVEDIKKSPEYIQFSRERKLSQIIK